MRLSVLVALASVCIGRWAAAQDLVKPVTIAGVVRDTTGRDLLGAEVRAGGRWVTSGPDGRFVLDSVPPDTIPLQIRRIGYAVEEVLLVANPGDRVEIAVRLTPIEVTLGTIVVEGKRMDTYLLKTGWYDRERLGMGVRFDPDYMAHFGGSVSGLLYNVPGVRVQRDHLGRATARVGVDGMHMCTLNVFLDGLIASWANDVGLDQIVAKQDIVAVEVYPRDVDMPQSFARAGTIASGGMPSPVTQVAMGDPSCGALMIWTRLPTSARKPKPEG